jgi:hypothetical protein
MSVFDQTTGQETGNAPAPAEATPTTESFVAKLVQERGEQWSDPEAIAKGKIEADQHIKNLETQLAEMRKDLEKQDYAKSLLEQVQNKAGEATTPTPAPSTENGGETNPNTTAETPDIQSLVEEALKAREAKQTVDQNVAQVDAALTEKFGTDAAKVVADKASALGLSLDRLKGLAAESPSAFMALVGEAPLAPTPVSPTSSVNTQSESFNGNTAKGFAHFQQMRRDNPKQYYSPAVQREMIAMRDKMGDTFFNS